MKIVRSRRRRIAMLGLKLLLIGSIPLLLLYLCEMIEPIEERIKLAEVLAFIRLNAMFRVNSVWDWTVFVGASEFFVALAALIAICVAGTQAWHSRRTTYGSLFGYIFFVVLIAVVAREGVDTVGNVIKRDSPTMIYKEKVQEGENEIQFLDFDNRLGVLDQKMATWAFVACLLLLYFPRLALVLLVMLGHYAFSHLALGLQWLVNIVSSVLVGAALAGGVLIAFRDVILWFERKSEEVFLRHFGHRVYDLPSLSQMGWGDMAEPDRDRVGQLIATRKSRQDRFWHELVRRDVLPLFASPDAPYQLARQPDLREDASFRRSRYVRFLKLPGGHVVVVKAISRLRGLVHKPKRIQRYLRSAESSLRLEKMGFPVPRMYWVKEDLTAYGLKDYFVSVEEFLDGRPIRPGATDEALEAVRLLARLHAQTEKSWGPLTHPEPGARIDYVLRHLRPGVVYFLGRLQRMHRFEFSEAELNGLWGLYEREALAVIAEVLIPFRLVHGDVTVRNFLACETGPVRMIDFVTVRYDFFAEEAIKAAPGLGGRDAAACAALWREYFRNAEPARWDEFRKLARLALARFALRELAHGRIRLSSKGAASKEQILAYIENLFRVDGAIWGESPEQTDWPALLALIAPSRPAPSDEPH